MHCGDIGCTAVHIEDTSEFSVRRCIEHTERCVQTLISGNREYFDISAFAIPPGVTCRYPVVSDIHSEFSDGLSIGNSERCVQNRPPPRRNSNYSVHTHGPGYSYFVDTYMRGWSRDVVWVSGSTRPRAETQVDGLPRVASGGMWWHVVVMVSCGGVW